MYDRWLESPQVEFDLEPRNVDAVFRRITKPLASRYAFKAIGDCWLLAHAEALGASLTTFDGGLLDFARKHRHSAVNPASI